MSENQEPKPPFTAFRTVEGIPTGDFRIDPIKICCGKKLSEHIGPMCPDGLTPCCLCFQRFELTDLIIEDGQYVDVCKVCDNTQRRRKMETVSKETTKIVWLVQVYKNKIWLTHPGYSGSDRQALNVGIAQLKRMGQKIRVVKQTTTILLEPETDEDGD